MKIEENHGHAITYYEALNLKSFIGLFVSAFQTKFRGLLSLTVHLPLEIQHPSIFKNIKLGIIYIKFGELLKFIFQINLYWENAPLLEHGTWKLKYGQLNWDNIPDRISLCMDTGHLMLGSANIQEAQKRILNFSDRFGKRIKHLHIHENNFKSDEHMRPKKVITSSILNKIKTDRTFIYEK